MNAPSNLRKPICLIAALLLDVSFNPIDTMFAPVLSISAGKDMKAPKGNFLKACIAGGTLE